MLLVLVCWSNISLYITRQFEKHSSCLGSPDHSGSTANYFPSRWLGIINWGGRGEESNYRPSLVILMLSRTSNSEGKNDSGWNIMRSFCDYRAGVEVLGEVLQGFLKENNRRRGPVLKETALICLVYLFLEKYNSYLGASHPRCNLPQG